MLCALKVKTPAFTVTLFKHSNCIINAFEVLSYFLVGVLMGLWRFFLILKGLFSIIRYNTTFDHTMYDILVIW